MNDIVRYVKEGLELSSRDQAREIIEDLKQKVIAGDGDRLEKAELLVTLAFSCVDTEQSAWEIINHFGDNSDFELLSSIGGRERIDEDKRCRILTIVELIRRLRK